MDRFELDPRIAADTLEGGNLQLCTLRVIDDTRFDWIVMVPRRVGLTELHDLPPPLRALLTEEIAGVSERLKAATGATKINIALFGNMVPQLHVHVVARHEGDAAWPGGAIGFGTRPRCQAEKTDAGTPAGPEHRQAGRIVLGPLLWSSSFEGDYVATSG